MRLEKIEINGFKSFADKTEILLDGDITGIVGPNGSGKSNIVDAVRWVLGEQNSKNLRGAKMEDVIFGGTQDRRRKAFCEVSLFFDNSDGKIASEYAEVSISRKLFRSGVSEYYINRSIVRLKDVLDLIQDTGIGKEGYSVVGQGRIDEILSSKPVARRKVFEEAAGVMKFRTRKEEAEHKLEKTQNNLVRIGDIVQELNTQIQPLKEQADKTRRYLALFDRQKLLEANIYVINYTRVDNRLKKLQEDLQAIEEELQSAQAEFEKNAVRLQSLSSALFRMDEALAVNRNLLSDMLAGLEKETGSINLLAERIQVGNRDISRIETERQTLEQKRRLLLDEKNTRMQTSRELAEKVRELSASIEEKIEEKKRIAEESAEQRNRAQKLRQEHLSLLSKKSGWENRLSALRAQQETLQLDSARTAQTEQKISRAIGKAQSGTNDVLGAWRKIKADIETLTKVCNTHTLRRNRKREEETQLAHSLEKAAAAYRDASSRTAFLKKLQMEYEGYSIGVKNLLRKAPSVPELQGLLGTLADLIEVPSEYEAAIQAALGGAMQNVVAKTEEDAKSAIAYLRKNRLGRVSFMPLSALKVRRFSAKETERMNGALLLTADAAVSCTDEVRPAVTFLLGRTAIVKDMEDAVALARKTGYTFRIVTLPGDLILPGGIMTGGSAQKKNFGLLSRKRDIETAEKQADKAKQQLTRLQEQKESIQAEREALEKDMGTALERLKQLGIQETEARMEERARQADLQRLEEEKQKLAALSKKNEEQKQVRLQALQTMTQEIEGQQRAIDAILVELGSMGQEDEEAAAALENVLSGLRVAKGQTERDATALAEIVGRIETEIAALDEQIAAKQDESAGLQASLRKTLAEKQDKEARSAEQQAIVSRTREEVAEAERAYKRLNQEIAEKQKQNTECQQKQASLMDGKYKLESQKDRLKLSIENLGNRLWADYSMTYADAVLLKQEISYTECAREAADIREKIHTLGTVNPNAIEEYNRLRERVTDLSLQKEDLEKAKEDLEKMIKSIVASMRTVFTEKFYQINRYFGDIFRMLFGGGKANLLLEEGDVMECGIGIDVQPPGKKLQNISLLSGGERALTGIALLFAMIKINPSPFCLLDEIDAPLDEANVERFCRYVKGLDDISQFLIITHKKLTMSMCNALFGVTMEEKGISRLVSVKIA